MRSLGMITGAAVLASAGMVPAEAATVFDSGSFGAGEHISINPSVDLDVPGKYRFTLAFSNPVEDAYGLVTKINSIAVYCKDEAGDSSYCGGDNIDIYYPLEEITPTQYAADVRINPPEVHEGSFDRQESFDQCCSTSAEIFSIDAGSYSFSVSAIPEPETWAMLLLGFGAIGASLRAKRHRRVHSRLTIT